MSLQAAKPTLGLCAKNRAVDVRECGAAEKHSEHTLSLNILLKVLSLKLVLLRLLHVSDFSDFRTAGRPTTLDTQDTLQIERTWKSQGV